MSDRDVYIVVTEGVYRHSIHGPYWTAEEAIGAANASALADRDSYHTHVVYRLGDDDKPLYSTDKDAMSRSTRDTTEPATPEETR